MVCVSFEFVIVLYIELPVLFLYSESVIPAPVLVAGLEVFEIAPLEALGTTDEGDEVLPRPTEVSTVSRSFTYFPKRVFSLVSCNRRLAVKKKGIYH